MHQNIAGKAKYLNLSEIKVSTKISSLNYRETTVCTVSLRVLPQPTRRFDEDNRAKPKPRRYTARLCGYAITNLTNRKHKKKWDLVASTARDWCSRRWQMRKGNKCRDDALRALLNRH